MSTFINATLTIEGGEYFLEFKGNKEPVTTVRVGVCFSEFKGENGLELFLSKQQSAERIFLYSRHYGACLVQKKKESAQGLKISNSAFYEVLYTDMVS